MHRENEVAHAPIVELDHDHDDSVVVLQDLHVLVRQALIDESRERALGEARRLLRYFQEDMRAHFQREETLLFPALRRHLPERAGAVEALARAHDDFRDLISRIDDVLHAHEVQRDALRQTLAQLDRLVERFSSHALVECELLRAMDSRVVDPAVRDALREQLSDV